MLLCGCTVENAGDGGSVEWKVCDVMIYVLQRTVKGGVEAGVG